MGVERFIFEDGRHVDVLVPAFISLARAGREATALLYGLGIEREMDATAVRGFCEAHGVHIMHDWPCGVPSDTPRLIAEEYQKAPKA
jgi:hypothetical protein